MVFHTRVNVLSGNLFLSVLQFHEHKTTHWRYPLYYISLSLGLFFNIFLNFSWCRCVNVLLTNPIWVIVTRMQVKFHIKKCIYLWDPGICQPKLKYNFCFYDCPINLVVFRKKKKRGNVSWVQDPSSKFCQLGSQLYVCAYFADTHESIKECPKSVTINHSGWINTDCCNRATSLWN